MAKVELKPWAPGCMVVETLSMRAAAPWIPDYPTWIDVEHMARKAITQAQVRSRYAFWRAQQDSRNG